MKLKDEDIRSYQLAKRKDTRTTSKQALVKIGDTVKLKNKKDKHQANDIFLVTNKIDNKVTMKKVLRPLMTTSSKLMSKSYTTNEKFLKHIYKPAIPVMNDGPETDNCKWVIRRQVTQWNPIGWQFYNDSDIDINEDDKPKQTY